MTPLGRYAAHVRHILSAAPSAGTEPLVAFALAAQLPPFPSHRPGADRGLHRPIYHPLRAYAAARAAQLAPTILPSLDRSFFESNVAHASLPSTMTTLPALGGTKICAVSWYAVALHTAARIFSESAWSARAARAMNTVISAQRPDGTFFTPTRSDSPEALWYHELVLLHAITSYGLLTNAPPILDRAKAAALYHLHETQPDHATTQPWALNAFLLSPDTYPLADQLLHTLQAQHPAGPDPISSILLADTLLTLPAER